MNAEYNHEAVFIIHHSSFIIVGLLRDAVFEQEAADLDVSLAGGGGRVDEEGADARAPAGASPP